MSLEAPKPWTQDEVSVLRSSLSEGKSWVEIAALLGRSRHAVVNKYNRLTEMPPRPRRNPITKEEIQQIREMTRLGYSSKRMRKFIHRGDTIVRQIMKDEKNVQRGTAEPLQSSQGEVVRPQLQDK